MSINKFLQPGATTEAGATSGNVVVGAGRNQDGSFGVGGSATVYTWAQDQKRIKGVTRLTNTYENAGLISSGIFYVAGDASYRQLGQGDTAISTVFIEFLGGGSGCIDAAMGLYYAMIIKEDGTLWGVGYNQLGRLGNGNTTNQNNPVQEASGWTDWEKVYVGYNSTAGLRNTSDLYVCGASNYGQYGIGTTTSQDSFIYSTGNVAKWVNDGENSLILTTDGELYGAGRNQEGQLGVGDSSQRNTWTQEASGFTWLDVSISTNPDSVVLAIKDDGTLWAWGDGGYSKHGLNNLTDYYTPQQVMPSASGTFVSVHAGSQHGAAVDDQGRLWYWGDDQYYQDGTSYTFSAPNTPLMIDDNWYWVSLSETTGRDGMMGIVKVPTSFGAGEGKVYGAGLTNNGQIGDGTKNAARVWTTEKNQFDQVSKITAAWQHAGIINNGVAYIAGESNYYQTNQGNTTDVTEYVEFLGNGSGCIDFNCHYFSTHIIKSDGTLWGVGENREGLLGVGDATSPKTTLTQEASGWTDWTKVYNGYRHTGALRGSDLYVCGRNSNYQLGLGDNTQRNSFVFSTGNVSKFQGGESSSLILTTAGEIYGVGRNEHGELGVGDQTQRTSWTQESLGYTWDDVVMFAYSDNRHVAAIRNDGSVWGWGFSSFRNENGDGTNTKTNTPTEIIPASSGTFVSIGLHFYGGYAVEDNGRLWFWGDDVGLQDGDGDDTDGHEVRMIEDNMFWIQAEGGLNWAIGIAQ